MILPNAGTPSLKVVSGFPNCVLLKALKNSARNSRAIRSVNAVVFLMERSTLCWAGPRSSPGLVLPKPVPPSELITGGVVKQFVLKYSFKRLLTEPPRSRCPLHPGALRSRYAKSLDVPKRLFELVLRNVSGVPDCRVTTVDTAQPLNIFSKMPRSMVENSGIRKSHLRSNVAAG